MKNIFIALIAVFSLILLISPVNAAWYAKFDGIDGEATSPRHERWTNILSIDWGSHKPGSGASGVDRARAGTVLEDFTISKEMDSTTPILSQQMCVSEGYRKVTIDLCGPGFDGSEHCYMRYEMENVIVTNYEVHGLDDGSIPTETLSLNFDKITETYFPLEDNGGAGEPVEGMCIASIA